MEADMLPNYDAVMDRIGSIYKDDKSAFRLQQNPKSAIMVKYV